MTFQGSAIVFQGHDTFYVEIMDHKLLLLEDLPFHFHQQYSNIFSSFKLDNDLAQKYAT